MIWNLTMNKGFAYLAWQIENNGLVPMDRATPGYLRQEIARLGGRSAATAKRKTL